MTGSHSPTSQTPLYVEEELKMGGDPRADSGLGVKGKRAERRESDYLRPLSQQAAWFGWNARRPLGGRLDRQLVLGEDLLHCSSMVDSDEMRQSLILRHLF
jgi:hypothetical protein